ncbi:histidine kinase [Amycolatopsis sp. NPDC051371]|uniref:sensor histidine kinase n=1 Tax=Amycolatopsis sp. NPDC051371 TaxID=3155800 RepID=UPI00342E3931
MPDDPPRPPRRLPPVAWAALTVCGFVVVLYGALGSGPEPAHEQPPAAWQQWVAALVLALPLGWARRRPSPVLAALLTGMVVATALHARTGQIWPLVLAADVLVGLITATASRRAGVTAAIVTLAVQEAVWQLDLWTSGGQSRALAVGMVALTVLIALFVLLAWIAGITVRQRREYSVARHTHAAAEAATAERLRIARELHDMIAHSIGIIAFQSGAARRVIDTRPDDAKTALTAIEVTSRDTLKELRHVLGALRDTRPTGLSDVDRLTEMAAAADVHVDVRWRGRRRPLPVTLDQSAFRIIQESVTNVTRHANTDHCQVLIDYSDEELRIEILDEGTGATSGETGYGIPGMRERVALLDGHFSAGPRAEGGFRVTARLPLPREAG